MRRLMPFLVGAAVVACAQSYRPVVDMQGVDPARYEADLADCRAYAEQVSPAAEAAGGGLIGALFGAAIGGVVGATTGGYGVGEAAATGAAVGGVSGAGGGALQGARGQRAVIANCLAGRGYRVLR